MSALISILEEVRAGRKDFAPVSSSEADMLDFQPIAKILVYAHQERLLEKCSPHREYQTGNDWYDLVMVTGGLSYKGERFLTESRSAIEAEELSDLVELKPNIYGIGVDLKGLWRRWKRGGK